MRIAQLVVTFPPYHGGMGNIAFSNARGLTLLGHHVEVFCPLLRGPAQEIEAPFKIHRMKPMARFRNSALVPQLISRLWKFDVIHLHFPFFGGAEAVLLLKALKKKKIRLVTTFHMDNHGRGFLKAFFIAYSIFVTDRILSLSDKVIVTSLDYAAHSSAARVFALNRNKFSAIPPGIDTHKFSPRARDSELMRKLGLNEEDRIVLFVGGLDRAHAFKGVDFLIEAWGELHLPLAKLLIVGQGDLRETYRHQAAICGLSDRVVFAEPVEDRVLPDYYNLADLLVLPSLNSAEAFGIVLLEAMACGVPVLASDLPGVRSVVKPGENGFVFQTGNKDDLKRKIELIINKAAFGHRLKYNNRDLLIHTYSQEETWHRLEEVLLEVCRI